MAPGAVGRRGYGVAGVTAQEPAAATLTPSPASTALPESLFPSRALAALDRVGEWLLAPSCWATNRLLDLQPTMAERRRWRRQCGRCGCCGCATRALAVPVLAAVLLLSLPVAALGLLLWLPAQAVRRPFAYQHTAGTAPAEPWDLRRRRTFTFITANVCLLPSGLAKFSNLGETPQRAECIARRIAPVPPDPADDRHGLMEPRHSDSDIYSDGDTYGGTLQTTWLPASGMAVTMPADPVNAAVAAVGSVNAAVLVPVDPANAMVSPADPVASAVSPVDPVAGTVPAVLSERFPADTDVVCLQEVFDGTAAARLRRRLGGTFPHVLWGAGARGLRRGGVAVLGSGLLVGSRFPVLAARFWPFPNGAREDALAAKGLLALQVLVGSPRGRRVVGYVGCTHLQAPAGDAAIRDAQVTLVLGWLRQFRAAQEQHGDVVAFDVLCGDLNFDNCSPGDALNQRHRLFEEYRDPCRRGPGQDEPWAIGTLLNYLRIYEEPVATPERMKRTLSQPGGRQQYLAGPILASGDPVPDPPGPPRGRRVDYVLYREHPPTTPLHTLLFWQELGGVTVITQLATLSDHLPVALRLHVTPVST
ncbi:sphingomyelin phosphodiesterase 5-like [Pterocles gutturalis]